MTFSFDNKAYTPQLQTVRQGWGRWCHRSDGKGRHKGQANRPELWFPPGHPALWLGGEEDIPLSSLAHPGSSGRLPAPGARIPGLRPSRPSKLFPQSQPPPPHHPLPRGPLPPKPRQPLAKAQVEAFDPGFGARGQESLPYLRRMLGLPGSRPLRLPWALYRPVPAVPCTRLPGSWWGAGLRCHISS